MYNVYVPIYKKINKDFFKKWTPNMAYVLGFFAADGYITVNKRGGQFWCIQITDKELLENIKKVAGSDHKISVRPPRKPKESVSFRIQIGSIEMCSDLRKLGFSEKKTKSLAVPNIPKKYFSSFVRGYFDGDGNVWSGLMHKGRKTHTFVIQTVFTSCSYNFLEKIREKLGIFNIKRGVLRKGYKINANYYRLTYSVINSLKLYDFMYNGLGTSELFLKRKKDVFENYIKMRL
jgi:intein-encoded DNA endonuclease-like protein